MPTTISQRILAMEPSATLAMSQKSSELKAAGVDVINLSVGEPDFNTPEHIKRAAVEAIDQNYTHYPPVPGYPDLREAIAEKLRTENHLSDMKAANVVVSAGAKHSLFNVIMSLINPGDEVVIPCPAWVSYVEMVKLAGGTPLGVEVGMEHGFKITPEMLEDAINERTRAVMLCSPSNPSGAVYSREELQGLVQVLARHPQVWVISDEIYEHINYTGSYTSVAEFAEIADRVVIINGVSKAYAMTGWRVGFMAGPIEVAKAVTKLQGQTTSGISSIAQRAALAAYAGSQQCVEEMRLAFLRRRDLIVALAKEIPGLELNVPDGAFYIFPRVKNYLCTFSPQGKFIESDTELSMYLLEEAHVATVAGSAFYLPGYLRLSYAAADSQLTEAMHRIAAALARLTK